MGKRVYISADYSAYDGDRNVVNVLHGWSNNSRYVIDFVDTAQVVSGSVSRDPDCRACDLKAEFNRQIDISSTVIFVIGDKTASRTAGSFCRRQNEGAFCTCTPYKQNSKGTSYCKYQSLFTPGPNDDLGNVNTFSYLEHEFRQARRKDKKIIIVYNSLYKQPTWLPSYMGDYAYMAIPFWVTNDWGNRVGNYSFFKTELGYE